MRVISD